jgi:hypothetical protein
MLPSTRQDPSIDFVLGQLKRANWISGHHFEDAVGYHLHWFDEGTRRMQMLQWSLNQSHSPVHDLSALKGEGPTHRAVKDFWEACLQQLSLEKTDCNLSALVRVIESWKGAENH